MARNINLYDDLSGSGWRLPQSEVKTRLQYVDDLIAGGLKMPNGFRSSIQLHHVAPGPEIIESRLFIELYGDRPQDLYDKLNSDRLNLIPLSLGPPISVNVCSYASAAMF